MKFKNKEKILNILIFILILSILLVIISTVTLFKQGFECKTSPFTYAAKQITETEIYCSCNALTHGYNPFYFDKSGVYQQKELYGPNYTPTNLSEPS